MHSCVTVIILSDANTVYIDYILQGSNVQSVISDIFTNPAHFEANGRLCVTPYQNNTQCLLCPTNLCKGSVLSSYLCSHAPFTKIVYVGDGRGDYCPSLQLRETDFILARANWALHKLLTKTQQQQQQQQLRAKVVPWDNGSDIYNFFVKAIPAKL